ncbi:unnamed protein product [Auanema sp. JU1783]|nr:unnamed protein product [Auanema sp. JU1783]
MSLDDVFQSDKQLFVSKPVLLRNFLVESVEARRSLEKQTNQKKHSKKNLQEKFETLVRPSFCSAENIWSSLEEFNNHYKNKQEREVFELDAPISSFPNVNLKTLKILKSERHKRLNTQYKSVSLRLLKYDMVDEKFFSYKPSSTYVQKHADLDQPTFCYEQHDVVSSSVKLEYEKNSFDANAESCPPSDFALSEEEMRSDNLFWGKDDLITSVSIFVGYARELRKHEIRMGRLLKVTDKILLSGQNTLYELRQYVSCPQDFMFSMKEDATGFQHPDMNLFSFPSSFFFIHDTFYIDDITPNAVDLTETIRMWAKRKSNIGPMKLSRMSETKIRDITARLGQPYVFVHSGTCEHLLCFNDLWLRSLSDVAGPFPFKLVKRNSKCLSCAGCRKKTAEWRVEESNQLPQSPMFFCNECYREFLFDENGNKFGQFSSIPYLDRQVMDEAGVFYQKLRKQFKKCDL